VTDLSALDPHTAALAREASDGIQTLESMFSDPGLSELRKKQPSHPAVVTYDLLHAFVRTGAGASFPVEAELLSVLGSAALDRLSAVIPAGGVDYWSEVEDSSARTWLVGRLTSALTYADALAEVFFWSWLRRRGFSVGLLELEGYPDLRLKRPNGADVWIEVKRLRPGTGLSRVRRVIKLASKQIRRADPSAAGMLVIRLERAIDRARLDSGLPSDVDHVLLEIAREMGSGHSRSVARVVLVWDEFTVGGEAEESTSYEFRRRSEIRDHSSPRLVDLPSTEATRVDQRVVFTVPPVDLEDEGVELPSVISGNVAVANVFRKLHEVPDGIRVAHALEAAAHPSGVAELEAEGERILVLLTKRVTNVPHPYLLLLVGRGEDTLVLHSGYRIYREPEGVDLAQDPVAAFFALLERYGAPVQCGPYTGLFFPYVRLERVEGEHTIFGVVTPDDVQEGEQSQGYGAIRVRDDASTDGREMIEIMGAYHIMISRYRSAAKARTS
jgi:hypothetical protein